MMAEVELNIVICHGQSKHNLLVNEDMTVEELAHLVGVSHNF